MRQGILNILARVALAAVCLSLGLAGAGTALAATQFFSTGAPDGKMATLARLGGNTGIETETADDFVLAGATDITAASFTGLLPSGASLGDIKEVQVEVYRIFPKDSTDPPSGRVPTRVNSPSDVAFEQRDSASGGLTFSGALINPSFSAANSVVNGIFPLPNVYTGGEGAVTGQEVTISVNFATPFTLGPDHYFFVPLVLLNSGNFLWLSAPRPITPAPDLQTWIRNESLAPDWLRIGTDITHSGPFNASFTLSGEPVPEPCTLLLTASGLAGLAFFRRKRSPCPGRQAQTTRTS